MGKSKEKRIKRIKRNRSWPMVLGLFLIMFIFLVLMVVVLILGVVDVIDNELMEGYARSEQITRRHLEGDMNSLEESYEGILSDIDLMAEIDAVAVLDENGEWLWSSDDRLPNLEEKGTYTTWLNGNTDTSGNIYEFIIEEDSSNIITKEDGLYVLSDNILSILNEFSLVETSGGEEVQEYVPIVSTKIWYATYIGDLEVYVLNDILIYSYDILLHFLMFTVFVVLILVFVIYYVITLCSVIASQKRATKVLYTDMVTGGDNWLSFVRKGNKLLKKNRRNRINYAVIHLRMEKYQSFCTCFGVKEGEEFLERLYKVLKKQVGRKETLAHYEQADFALLLQYTNEDDLKARIKQIEETLDNITSNVRLYFSAGVCMVEKNQKDVEELYNNAISATNMLEADVEDKIAFFDVEMKKQQLWERKVEDEMTGALQRKEFKVYLQPKYGAKDETIAGAEALVRWIHPTEGFIPPNKFIPIFEKNGFILQLDDYMIDEVARQQAQWIADGKHVVPISVNVSRAHFTREDLAEHICSIVDKYQVPHSVIELELTESAFFDDKQVLLNTVDKLRSVGFIVSMDDFGAGYSSLNSLKELNIDVLKIDADFFRGMGSAERGMLIVSKVIELAKKLEMKIVAEGIESRDQVDFLATQDCDLIQGYYFAKPMPIEEFEALY